MFNYFLLYNGTNWIITRNIMKSLSEQGGALIIIPLGKYGTAKAAKKPAIDSKGVYIERYRKPQYIYKFSELKRIAARYI